MIYVAELEKPDIELRKNILRNKIKRDGLTIPESVIGYIAESVNESVRELRYHGPVCFRIR